MFFFSRLLQETGGDIAIEGSLVEMDYKRNAKTFAHKRNAKAATHKRNAKTVAQKETRKHSTHSTKKIFKNKKQVRPIFIISAIQDFLSNRFLRKI